MVKGDKIQHARLFHTTKPPSCPSSHTGSRKGGQHKQLTTLTREWCRGVSAYRRVAEVLGRYSCPQQPQALGVVVCQKVEVPIPIPIPIPMPARQPADRGPSSPTLHSAKPTIPAHRRNISPTGACCQLPKLELLREAFLLRTSTP